ncbi:MAG: long-chain fatty acid--CoA ligase [Candidatus Obscuribacterales bacterium]|nr:long-chain fatty acid--CoA ligase [Candidatus Obscuribacterales bacterium]
MTDKTIIHIFWERVKESPERTAILHKNSTYRSISWRESGSIAERIAAALIKQGINKEDKVAIMSSSCPQWTWTDVAALSLGAVVVPIYPSLSASEAGFVIEHSQASAIFLENQRQLRKLAGIESLPEALKFVVLLEGEAEAFPLPVFSWEQFLKIGAAELEQNKDCVQAAAADVQPADLATIVYTSGTTGVPKGAMIPHRNIYYVCKTLAENVGFTTEDLALSFLPLSHIFERIGGQFLAVYQGLPLAFAESMESVAQNITEVKPTVMNAVPRFYEKAYNKIQNQIRSLPTPQQYFARWALSIGRRALKAREESSNGKRELAAQIYRTELKVADRFVFRKIRQRFGGRLRFLVSGAAPLSTEVHQFFESIGIPILEGYGLTETTAPIACNKPSDNRRGTVGKPLPGVELKLADDGEILVRGPNVFSGYYRNDEATKAAFQDGWFLTGDIGELDADGFLRIKDRKKDIIITAGGKHVAPQILENMLAGQGLISRILVYGDRRKYISALITLNQDELKSFAGSNSISFNQVEELSHHPSVMQSVQNQVNESNARLASFEQIKRFHILENDFSIESNELTPTLKVKRKFVTEKYKQILDSLYEKEDILQI